MKIKIAGGGITNEQDAKETTSTYPKMADRKRDKQSCQLRH